MKKYISLFIVFMVLFAAVGLCNSANTLKFTKIKQYSKDINAITYEFDVLNLSLAEVDVAFMCFVIGDENKKPIYSIPVKNPLHLKPGEKRRIKFNVDENIKVEFYKFTFIIKAVKGRTNAV